MIDYVGLNLKVQYGAIVENIVSSLYAKFNCDRLWNGKVLGNWKSDTKNSNKNNIGSDWGPKIIML